jgi:DNA integrity scanning protein DisA with diadenylate cyclase activity
MAKKPKIPKSTDEESAKNDNTSEIMLDAAWQIVHQAKLQALLLYVDGLKSLDELESLDFTGKIQVILVARSDEAFVAAEKYTKKVVRVPQVNLTRIGQIKMAVMLSFSQRLLKPQDKFVFLTGLAKGELDTIMVMEVGREHEMFQSVDQPPLTEHIRRAVFERVFNLALELANEGREGKPIGAIFVLGDSAQVIANSRQMIMNPFKGYPDGERNILDNNMTETVKEFSTIDGAFVIKGTGTILSAGTYLLPKLITEELPQGLGTRHAAAAAITAATKSIAITISESTGAVRIWRQGRLVTEIEKAKYGS